jgi:GAF domain-containing protein
MNRQREQALTRVFVGLADTLVADYDVIDLLHRLADACVDLLGVHAAGMVVSDRGGNLAPLAASTEDVGLLQLLQLQSGEGPALDCVRSGEPVICSDLTTDGTARWPRFAARTRDEGFASVHALPLRLRAETIGALSLFRTPPGPFPASDLLVAQALADVATIGILQERIIRSNEVLAGRLDAAVRNLTIVEQAKGVLAARFGLGMDESLALLRDHARTCQQPLLELAGAVVSGTVDLEVLRHGRFTTGPATT